MSRRNRPESEEDEENVDPKRPRQGRSPEFKEKCREVVELADTTEEWKACGEMQDHLMAEGRHIANANGIL